MQEFSLNPQDIAPDLFIHLQFDLFQRSSSSLGHHEDYEDEAQAAHEKEQSEHPGYAK